MFMKAVLLTATLLGSCSAHGNSSLASHGQVALDISGLGEDQLKIAGTVEVVTDGITQAHVEAATQAALAGRLSVDANLISVTASSGRRLGDKALPSTSGGARKLADTWSIVFEVNMNAADGEDFKTTARNLRDDDIRMSLFGDVLNQHLVAVTGDSSASATVNSLAFTDDISPAPEEEADGAHTLSCNFFLVFVAFMVTSVLTK